LPDSVPSQARQRNLVGATSEWAAPVMTPEAEACAMAASGSAGASGSFAGPEVISPFPPEASNSSPPVLRSRSSRRLSDALEDAQLKLAGKQVRTAITLLARDGAVNRVEHMMVHQARRSTQWDLIVTKLHENNADGTQSMTHMPSMLAKSRSTVRQQTRSRKAAAGPSSDHVDFSTQYQPMLDERELEAGRDGGGGVRVRPLTLAEAGAVKALEVLTMAVLRLKRKRQRGQAQSE